MKFTVVHYLIAIIFLIFGIIQYNDPDFWLWGPIYLLVAAVPIFYVKNKLNSIFLLVAIIVYTAYFASYIPDFIDWVNGGMDNIAGSMKAEEPHIELTREFLGLFICLVTLLYYYWALKKKQ